MPCLFLRCIINFFQDTHRNRRGVIIDGEIIRGKSVIKNGKEAGFWPDCGPKQNSDYMGDYLNEFGKQIRAWIDNESLIHLSQETELCQVLRPLQIFKTTIEPNKPRFSVLNS